MEMWRRRYQTRELSTKVMLAVVTPGSEGSDKGGASLQIVSAVACRKDAQLNLQRAVSEEGLPCIEDFDD